MGTTFKTAAAVLLGSVLLTNQTGATRQQGGANSPSWPGWGGPDHDFSVPAADLATSWPAGGPKRLWSRPLGNGYSAISVDGSLLYTMYRPPFEGREFGCSEEEVVVALDAATGRTVWEHRYSSSNADRTFDPSTGCGPHATPLIVGDRLFTVATNKVFLALDKKTGKLLWAHDFVTEFGTTPRNPLFITVQHGHAPSPLAYKDMVITMVGGPGQGVMAFKQDGGRVVWKSGTFGDIANASPILIRVDGEEQIVVMSSDGTHAFDPNTGLGLWNMTLSTWHGANISTPIYNEEEGVLCVPLVTGNIAERKAQHIPSSSAATVTASRNSRNSGGIIDRRRISVTSCRPARTTCSAVATLAPVS